METRELAITALRVLSAWTNGSRVHSDDVKFLRAHAQRGEADLDIDELACRFLGRTCHTIVQDAS